MNTASASSGTIATPTPRRGRAPAAMAVMMSSPQRFSFEIFATMAPRAARRQPTSLAKPGAAALWSAGERPSGETPHDHDRALVGGRAHAVDDLRRRAADPGAVRRA